MPAFRFLAVLIACCFAAPGLADVRLLMAEQTGCYWCEAWDKEIGPIYPRTAEGRTAPLWRFDIDTPPGDVVFQRSLNFTPTFVLIRDGVEIGRIEGYPGADFFWGLLDMLLDSAQIEVSAQG